MSSKSKAPTSNTLKETSNAAESSSNELWAADKNFADADDADEEDQDYDRFFGAVGEGCSPPCTGKNIDAAAMTHDGHADNDVSDQELEFSDLGLISCSSNNKANKTQQPQQQANDNKKGSKFNKQRLVVLEDNDSDSSDYKDAEQIEKKPWAKTFNMIAPSPAAAAATAAKNNLSTSRIPAFATRKKPFDIEINDDSFEDKFFQSSDSHDNDVQTWTPSSATSTFKYKGSSGSCIPPPAPKKTWPTSNSSSNNKYDSDDDSWPSFEINDKNVARGAAASASKKVVKPPVKLPMSTKKS
jgi:hypothetical protein